MRFGGRAGALATAVLVLTLAACGGDDDDARRADDDITVTEDDAASLEAQQANAPRCADLFALGVKLPAQMPDFCKDHIDAMQAVVFYDCGDDRRLFQVETEAGQAWAFTEGTVQVVPDLAADPRWATDYEECTG